MKYGLSLMVLLGSCAFFFAESAGAFVKWVDADGKVVYSDVPPPGVDAKNVRSTPGGGQGASAPQKSIAEQEADLKKSRQSKEDAVKKEEQEAADIEAKNKNCESARGNLRTLESGIRVTTVDANGERVFLDDAAIQQRIEEARRIAEQNCH